MPTRSSQRDDVVWAEQLVEEAARDPRRVVSEGEAWLGGARHRREARTVVLRAMALAHRTSDRPSEATRHARQAAGVAHRAGLPEREAEARLTLSLCLFEEGRTGPAMRELERCSASAAPELSVRATVQRAILLERLGRVPEAIELYRGALAEPAPPLVRGRVLNNLAIALAFAGRPLDAAARLHEALDVFREADAAALFADATHNLGFVLSLAADLPGSLAAFDEADRLARQAGLPAGGYSIARARVLLRANLYEEAAEAAQRAVSALGQGGSGAEIADALVLLAEASLGAERLDDAVEAAQQARQSYRRQGRLVHAATADLVIVSARVAAGDADRRLYRLALRCVDGLAGAGLADDELAARLLAARIGSRLGQRDDVRRLLEPVRRARRSGPLLTRLRAWLAEAILRADGGRGASAQRAVHAGLDVLAELQATLGASELRASVAAHGRDLADLGLGLALAQRAAWRALDVLERWRGGGILLGAVASADMAGELAALRAARAQLDEALQSGEDVARAQHGLVTLEGRVRAQLRRAPGVMRAATDALSRDEVVRKLDGRVLVSYFERAGRFGAIVGDGRRLSLVWPLAPAVAEVTQRIDHVLFGLRRMTSPRAALGRHDVRAAVEAGLADLGADLVAPLRRHIDGRSVVIVPTGPLHALPWSAMAGLQDQPVAVTPSFRVWLNRRAPTDAGGAAVLVAGPGLPGARREVAEVAELYASAKVFGPVDGTVERVSGAMEGAFLAHLACHGHFRTDNPLFSSVRLADGPMSVVDIERLERPPALIVLAACDVGTSSVVAGDQLLGVVGALLTVGAATVVASLLPVPDDASVAFMRDFHGALAKGDRPATALVAARAEADLDDPAGFVTAAAFTCYGAG